MDRELQDWYEDQFEMTNSEAWKELMLKVNELIEVNRNIDNIKTEQDLYFRKGQVDILSWLAGWRQTLEQVHKELLEDASNV